MEDFRIDLEDGYGDRSDSDEDGDANSLAKVARGMKENYLSPFIGIASNRLQKIESAQYQDARYFYHDTYQSNRRKTSGKFCGDVAESRRTGTSSGAC